MLKLMSLNMEGRQHLDRVSALITKELPDCICLQEMPASFVYTLVTLGYYPIFAPRSRETPVCTGETDGVCIATRTPGETSVTYYDGTRNGILPYQHRDTVVATSYPVIRTRLSHSDGQEYTIATIHLMVTFNGLAIPEQTVSSEKLIAVLDKVEPHILCGDFNMPRGYNTNYELFTQKYTDTIPQSYASSLDRTLHRDGQTENLHAPIFNIYMVDYIFSQPPYIVSDVRLEFGVSDHAAVIAQISKQ